jgi:DNA-binding SARP family transcriptional activator/Flp pilus assembly protein TadD
MFSAALGGESPVAVRVEFGLLGPLVVRCQGAVVSIAQGKQRSLLAALLLDAGRLLTTGQLIEVLWGGAPPASGRAALHNQVKRLRDTLGESGRDRIRTQPGGYLIHLEPGELDVTRMQDLLASAWAAARGGAWEQASALAAGAVLLWRGQPLADVDSQILAGRIPQLTESYLQAVETRLEAEVNLGRHAEVIGELRRLTADQPFREHTHALLMLALYRCGRQGEALAAYQSARELLVDELGSEPGPDLRALHRRILAADPALAPPDAENEPSAPARSPATEPETVEPVNPDLVPEPRVGAEPERARPETPHQLPAGVRHFAGRNEQLGELARLLKEVGQPGRTVVISAVGGTAGIGKTALALHWAHQVADEFPDGQLYANLRGFDPSGPPVAAEAVVRDFLGALGVPLARIPVGAEAQSALYRTVLATRRVLVVLDNARDADQVRSLLPGASGCFVLLTSRARLVSLAASEGAHLLTLDLPSVDEARELLSCRLGASLVTAEPEAADELIRLCARLPLALGIVAARAAASPGVRLAALAAELADTPGRLDVLDAGTPASGVRAAFSWSCRGLSDAAARMFRLLGVHPGPDISAAAAASLTGLPRPAARSALRELAQAGLIAEHVPGRFALHDLIRIYAAEQAGAKGAELSSVAFNRLLDHYLLTGYAAALALNQHRAPITVPAAQPGVVPEEISDRGQALAWFEIERQGLQDAIAAGAAAGLDLYAWQLAWTLVDFLNWRGYWHSHIAIQTIALGAAQRLGESSAEASVHRGLSRACAELGRLGEAVEHLHRSLAIYRELDDLVGQGHAHMGLAVAMDREGRIPEALGHGRHALDLYQSGHDQPGEAAALNAIGWCHALLGEYEQAFHHSQQALALHQMLGNQAGAAYTWDTLGYVHHHLGEYARAEACYRSALELFRDVGIAYSTADTLTHLGETCREAGDMDAARDAWEQALSILRDLDHADAADVRAKLADLKAASRTA